jgi:hypothetical protein
MPTSVDCRAELEEKTMIAALTQLLVLQLVGEVIARGLKLPIPGPVIGMLLLFLLLALRRGPTPRTAVDQSGAAAAPFAAVRAGRNGDHPASASRRRRMAATAALAAAQHPVDAGVTALVMRLCTRVRRPENEHGGATDQRSLGLSLDFAAAWPDG